MGDGPNLVAASSSKSAPTKPKNHTAKSVAKPIGWSNEPTRSTVIERLALSEPVPGNTQPQVAGDYGHKRDERLVLVENLRPGPYQHKNPPDDPNFDRFEPHSSTRLSYVSTVSRNRLHPNIRSAPSQIAEYSARPICRPSTWEVLYLPLTTLLRNTPAPRQARIRGSSRRRVDYHSCGS